MGFIDKKELCRLAKSYGDNDYGRYLLRVAEGEPGRRK
jgi:hypothetical protein